MDNYEDLKRRLLGMDDVVALNDCFTLCVDSEDHNVARRVREKAVRIAREKGDSKAGDLYWRTILFDAPIDFDCFMRYCERYRPLKEQFWLPRRNHLMPVCKALQDMEDGNLDELFLSCPPRIGKTTIMLFFLAWVMGRDSERSNLYCSYTDSVVQVLYNGVLELLNDPATYSYYDVFPKAKVVSTNAQDKLINLDRRKRYASFTGRSLYGTLNGACDCNGYLISDDLISGIEEAMNKDRLANAWAKVDNNMLPRAKMSAKVLWIGTRWSLVDPQGVRIDLLANDPKYKDRRWKVLNTPALDDNDESNFDYGYGVGFNTEYFQQRRASFERNNDMASWSAQYQGEPIERDGSLFEPSQLRYYNGVLPDGDPDRIFMAVDPAWGGGDFVAAPVCYQFGDDIYVADVVYSNEEKNITQPAIAKAVKDHHVAAVKVEGTRMTAAYGENIDDMLRKQGIRVNMRINTSHFTGNGKRQRIFDKAPDIRDHMIFLADGHRTKAYSMFMQSVFSFTITGKQAKHDDAADSLAMAVDFAMFSSSRAEILKRPF